jgi:hypothetical protein
MSALGDECRFSTKSAANNKIMTEKYDSVPRLQESSEGEEKRIEIPSVNWHMAIANAIKEASEPTVLVVNTEAKKELALSAAERMGKKDLIQVKIEEGK